MLDEFANLIPQNRESGFLYTQITLPPIGWFFNANFLVVILLEEIKLNTIYNEDCLQGMQRIPSKSIDMILCDLPYGTTACKWDNIINFDKLWEHYNRIVKENGAIVLTANQPFTNMLVMSNIKNYKHSWVWNKKNAGNILIAKYQPLKTTENILIFGKKGKKIKYFPILSYGHR